MITPEYIKKLVESLSTLNNLEKKTRKRHIVMVKNLAIYLCKEYTPSYLCTNQKLADLFGYNNHSSIVHCRKVFTESLRQKWFYSYKALYKECEQILLNKIEQEKINNLTIEFELVK